MVESNRIRSSSVPADVPTWGYHPVLGARVFELPPGRDLPAGWADVPHAGQHPHDADMPRAPATEGEDRVAGPSRRDAGRGRNRRATDSAVGMAPPASVELRAPKGTRNARMARRRKDGRRRVRAGREEG